MKTLQITISNSICYKVSLFFSNPYKEDNTTSCNQTQCAEVNYGHASCVNDTCTCDQFYYGTSCNLYCENGMSTPENTTCMCNQDWFGASCSVYCDSGNTCSGNGQCSNSGKCECDNSDNSWWSIDSYGGEDCSVHNTPWGIITLAITVLILVIAFSAYMVRRQIMKKRRRGKRTKYEYIPIM